jgi:CHAD domain-containing protein
VAPLPAPDVPALPGTLAAAEPLPLTTPGEVVARFQGRGCTLAEGVTWLEGQLSSGGPARRVARLYMEGPATTVLPLAARLAEDLPLLPARTSLHEAALALAEARPPRPRRTGPADLAGARTVGQALRAATGHLLEVLLVEAPGCTIAAGPRGVHQTRVALRRLRSLLRIFRPEVDGPPWRAWDGALRDLAGTLGTARDWDVFLPGLGAATLAALDGDARLKRMLGAAARERTAAYAGVAEALEGKLFRQAIWSGLALVVTPAEPGEDAPLAPFAAGVLRRRWRRLKRAGRIMKDLDHTALHEMRLDAKRLRYAAEPFAALWPGKAARRFNRRLANLQEALGLANDAVVARALAARLAGRGAGGFALGAVTGYAAGRAEGSRLAALEAWKALRRNRLFWKDTDEDAQ